MPRVALQADFEPKKALRQSEWLLTPIIPPFRISTRSAENVVVLRHLVADGGARWRVRPQPVGQLGCCDAAGEKRALMSGIFRDPDFPAALRPANPDVSSPVHRGRIEGFALRKALGQIEVGSVLADEHRAARLVPSRQVQPAPVHPARSKQGISRRKQPNRVRAIEAIEPRLAAAAQLQVEPILEYRQGQCCTAFRQRGDRPQGVVLQNEKIVLL